MKITDVCYCIIHRTNNNSFNKQNIAYLINDIDYNLILAIIFILNINISVLICILGNTAFIEMI